MSLSSAETIVLFENLLAKTLHAVPLDETNALEYERLAKKIEGMGQILRTTAQQKINSQLKPIGEDNNGNDR